MISTERRRAPLWLPWLLLALVTIGALAFCHLAGWWLYSSDGERLLRDFVGQWAASRRAIGGEAALAYDWRLHPTYLASLTGEPEPVALYFVYPPHFLFLVLPLAPFGYVEASIAMLAITFACYVLAVNGIVRSTGTALLVALSGGGAFYALFWVQNSLLVAALLVGGLVALPRRPVLAGVLFGLLTIKPQLGLLLPLVLLIDRRWSTILSATVTTLCLLLLSELAFGAGINRQFLQAMAQTPQFLDMTRLDPLWQTVFGLARQWFGDGPGWALHLLVAAIVAFAVGVSGPRRPFRGASAARG